MPRRLLNRFELAQALGVSVAAADNWRRQGRFSAIYRDRRPYFDLQDVLRDLGMTQCAHCGQVSKTTERTTDEQAGTKTSASNQAGNGTKSKAKR